MRYFLRIAEILRQYSAGEIDRDEKNRQIRLANNGVVAEHFEMELK
jgi:hypothetical protein